MFSTRTTSIMVASLFAVLLTGYLVMSMVLGFTSDQIFAHLVYTALPPTILYPAIYGLTSPWWQSWIGRALLTKAIGVMILIMFSALFQFFGPGYWGRDAIRISGMIIALVGFYMALGSLIEVKYSVWKLKRTPLVDEPDYTEEKL